jgi:hypothetical protein
VFYDDIKLIEIFNAWDVMWIFFFFMKKREKKKIPVSNRWILMLNKRFLSGL